MSEDGVKGRATAVSSKLPKNQTAELITASVALAIT